MKDTKYTVAVIIKNNLNPNKFLIVKRPDEDKDHGGKWGLPAVTLKPGELPEHGAIRVCKEKLNCEGEPERFLGIMFQKRNSYDIFLMDIDIKLIGNKQPNVLESTTDRTSYVDQKWTSDPMELMPGAKAGSCCASIFLTDRGLLDKAEWIASLEGSDVVD